MRTFRFILILTVFLGWSGQDARSATDEAVRNGPVPLTAPPVSSLEILSYDHGDVSPWTEFFAFDSPSHPKLVQLRREQKLDEIVKGADSDLERAVALKSWVVRSLKHGVPSPDVYRDWSADQLAVA